MKQKNRTQTRFRSQIRTYLVQERHTTSSLTQGAVVVSKFTLNKLDHWMYSRCVRYARHTHPLKPWKWIVDKYWGKLKQGSENRWVFGDKQSGAYLLQMNCTPIVRHVLILGRSSPDDPALRDYWEQRRQRQVHDMPRKWFWLAKAQKGCCTECGSSLFNGEELHRHHVVRRKDGGTDDLENQRLVHLFCHRREHRSRKDDDAQMEALQFA